MMTISTIQKLNHLNHQFYETISQEFSQTRQLPWEGWRKLVPYIEKLPNEISVLDVGCGNGRFLTFLQKNFSDKKIDYTGIDNSEELLKIAKNTFPRITKFKKIDILTENWQKVLMKEFDLVVSFGVIHHIPGFKNREDFINKCFDLTKVNGICIFTAWQFADQQKWIERMIPFSQIRLQSTEVEENDFLIDWQSGKNAIRYCHHTSDQEIESILSKLPKNTATFFRSDGKTGQDNVYCVIQKNATTSKTLTKNF